MKMDQVAYAYKTDKEKAWIKASLGLAEQPWVHDVVTADVTVHAAPGIKPVRGVNVAELEFCHAMGMQFELIRAVSGPSWISNAMTRSLELRTPFIAHIGVHLDDGEPWPPINEGRLLVQEAFTTSHRNEQLIALRRRYHYRIFEVAPFNYVKYIRRLTVTESE